MMRRIIRPGQRAHLTSQRLSRSAAGVVIGAGGVCVATGLAADPATMTFEPSARVFGRLRATVTFSSNPLSIRITLPSVPATVIGVSFMRLSGPTTATIRLPSRMMSAGAGTSM